MIDFGAIVGKITGRGAADQGITAPAGATADGVATGGAFAALVQLAAQVDAQGMPGALRLVVDNGAAPAVPAMPVPVMSVPAMSVPAAAATDGAPAAPPTAPAAPVPAIDMAAAPAAQISTIERLTKKAALPMAQPVADAAQIGTPVKAEAGEAAPAASGETDVRDEDESDTPAPAPADTAGAPVVALIAVPTPQPAAATQAQPTPATSTPTQPTGLAAVQPAAANAVQPAASMAAQPAAAGAAPPMASPPVQPEGDAGDPIATPGRDAPAAAVETVPARSAEARPGQTGAEPVVTPEAEQAARQILAALRQQTAAPAGKAAPAAEAQALPAEMQAAALTPALTSAVAAPDPAAARPARGRTARAGEAAAAVDPASLAATPALRAGKAALRAEDSAPQIATTAKVATDAAPAAAAAEAPKTADPLRAIVDGLPPMIQSELAARPVAGVTGPATSEALADKVVDMGVSGQWIDRMAQEIASLADGSGHSRFTLSPPHLGKLQVDLWQGDDATNVRLIAETDEAAQRLAEGRHSLATDARLAALNMGTITVEKAREPAESGREQRNQDQRPGQDLSGQAQQQNGQGQAQARSGQGGQGGSTQGSDWVRRRTPDQTNETSDAKARASAQRSANGRVRFA